jgi:hypothetical protein
VSLPSIAGQLLSRKPVGPLLKKGRAEEGYRSGSLCLIKSSIPYDAGVFHTEDGVQSLQMPVFHPRRRALSFLKAEDKAHENKIGIQFLSN